VVEMTKFKIVFYSQFTRRGATKAAAAAAHVAQAAVVLSSRDAGQFLRAFRHVSNGSQECDVIHILDFFGQIKKTSEVRGYTMGK